jgi:hypothetical protein
LSRDTEAGVGAFEKTKETIRCFLAPALLEENTLNPNKMSDREFNNLCRNIEETGLTDPILIRPLDRSECEKVWTKAGQDPETFAKAAASKSLRFRVVGGHHRLKAALYLDFDEVPVTIVMAEDFDDDAEKFQIVRMNAIHGKMDPQSFMDLVQSLEKVYGPDVMQEAFAISDDKEWQKLINQTAKALPDKTSQDKFKEAAKEIKTVDGLSKLLNEMFTKFGDTLPFGYMVFDHGGQRSMWLRIEGKTMKALDLIGEQCIEKQRTIDDVVGAALQLIAQGETPTMPALVKKTSMVTIPKKMAVAPTKDHLDSLKGVA